MFTIQIFISYEKTFASIFNWIHRNDPMYSRWINFIELFISLLEIHWLKFWFGTSLIIWIFDQYFPHYNCHRSMINPNKLSIYKLLISYYMNLKLPCNLWKPLNFKTIQIDHNNCNIYKYIFFHILCSWNIFKVWFLISKFTLLKDSILWLNQLHVNHKSHVY
jgi:hypothetical protein